MVSDSGVLRHTIRTTYCTIEITRHFISEYASFEKKIVNTEDKVGVLDLNPTLGNDQDDLEEELSDSTPGKYINK